MASMLDSVDKMPAWQRLVVWLAISVALVAVWYFLFYMDVVDERAGAEQGLSKPKTELERVKEKQTNFIEEQREHEKREAQFREEMEILPMNASTVENLMGTFQQKARQVGLSFDKWSNEPEQRQGLHSRLPIKVQASGTWAQAGEFFRQLSELQQIVSVENIQIKGGDAPEEGQEHSTLEFEFDAATYRFIGEEERKGAKGAAKGAKSSRRGKKGAK
jgi:Tfp pilus assembly protein PilO